MWIWDRLGPGTFASVLHSLQVDTPLLEEQNSKKKNKKLYGFKSDCTHASVKVNSVQKMQRDQKPQLPFLKGLEEKQGVRSKSRANPCTQHHIRGGQTTQDSPWAPLLDSPLPSPHMRNKLVPSQGASKQGTYCLFSLPSGAAGVPIKPCLNVFLASSQFLLIGKDQEPWWIPYFMGPSVEHLSFSKERIWEPPGPPKVSSPWVTPLGGLSTLSQARLSPSPFVCFPSHSPFPLCPFPSPEISLLLCLLLSLSSLLFYPSERMDLEQLHHHFSWLVRPAPTGQQWLTFMGDEWKSERFASHHADLGPAGSPWEGIYESDSGSDLKSYSGWKSNHPNSLTFIFLPPREVPLGMGWSGNSLYTVHAWLRVRTCGLQSHRRHETGWFPDFISPVGSGQVPPSFPGSFCKWGRNC